MDTELKQIRLIRVAQSDAGTFGVLVDRDVAFALTMEEPWRDNARSISCIPPGAYLCRRVRSPKFGDTFEVTGVPGRSHILFHKGNSLDDTEGCIMVGEEFAMRADGAPIIASSTKGYAELMRKMEGLDTFQLVILGAP